MFDKINIEKPQFYVDQSIKAMETFISKKKTEIDTKFKKVVSFQKRSKEFINLNKQKDLEIEKVKFINIRLNKYLTKIIKSFPKKFDEIYIDLINTQKISHSDIKNSLDGLWEIKNKLDKITKSFDEKIKKTKTNKTLDFVIKKFLGKVKKLFLDNSIHFSNLKESSFYLKSLPKFLDIPTISIGGFPNVGKSTLMKKLTNSNVEIKNYPFTTKNLMFSYIKNAGTKQIQFIDTPGLLNREVLNSIEKKAQIIITKYSSMIIYVLDVTTSCGFDLKKQLSLLEDFKKLEKQIIIYFSKKDIFNELDNKNFLEIKKKTLEFESFDDYEKVLEYVKEKFLKNVVEMIR